MAQRINFYSQGHRGARGLFPENTIGSMIKAVDLGMNTVELDVRITRDKRVVVTHDPKINPDISSWPGRKPVTRKEAEELVIYQMDYKAVHSFDVGIRGNPKFPEQIKQPAQIPLLEDLISTVESYCQEKDREKIIYNVEIKAERGKDGVWQPKPQEFTDLVMEVLANAKIDNRFYISSFYPRILRAVHTSHPEAVVGFLTEDDSVTLALIIQALGFTPQIYSPHFSMITKDLVTKAHKVNIKVVGWTVNDNSAIEQLLDLGIDGIITDYPDRLKQALTAKFD